jgi:hypothetical protein
MSQTKIDFRTLYSGKRSVLGDALRSHDPSDQYGWAEDWRYAVADALVWEHGERVPGIHPLPFGPEPSYAYATVQGADADALRYAFKILSRFAAWLELAGQGD